MSLTEQEELRVKELKQIGFELVEAGLVTNQTRKSPICYWRYMRGNRVSALHPHPEAAWRDCIREWEANLATAQSQPAKRYPANKELGEQVLEALLVKHGFTIKDHSWSKAGVRQPGFTGFPSRSATLKDAVAYWSQHSPNEFLEAVLAATDESKLDEMMRRQVVLTDIMIKSGVTIDIDKAKETYLSLSGEHLPIDAMKKALEFAGYVFGEVSWGLPSGAFNTLSTGIEGVVRDAWKHALDKGINEADLCSVANGCNMTEADVQTLLKGMFPKPRWKGVGQPPVGTTLWVTPCNTLWGFPEVGTYLCEVLAYRDEYVWLELLSDMGENTYTFTTTRTDKVDVKVWKGNNHA